MAKITSNTKMWVAKLDVSADESISLKSNLAIKLQLWWIMQLANINVGSWWKTWNHQMAA